MPAPRKAKVSSEETTTIDLRRIDDATLAVPIEGITPLIPHRWAEKAKAMMRAKQYGETVRSKLPPKDPRSDAVEATYWLPSDADTTITVMYGPEVGETFAVEGMRPAMPATAFKSAMVDACRFFDGFPMTRARTLFFVEGEGGEQLVPLKFEAVEAHEDLPRNDNGNPDLRYRCYILQWSAVLNVRFIKSSIGGSSIVSLADASGRVGVGDWRPFAKKSNTGTYGQYRVKFEDLP